MNAFVGRAREVERVRSLVDSEAGGILAFVGEPGIGKSALLDMAASRGTVNGMAVVRADADELGSAQPFGMLSMLLGATAAVPLEADLAPLAVVDRAIDAVEQRAAGATPLLVLDNLQWADPGSLRVLTSVLRRMVPLGWRAVLAARPAPVSEAAARLFLAAAEAGGSEVALGPLTAAETLALVRDRLGDVPTVALQRDVQQAGGNPFYVTTLLREWEHEGRLVRGTTGVGLEPGATPTTLSRMIMRRARELGPDATDVLCCAAVLGRQSTADDVAAVLGAPMSTVQAARVAAIEAGLLDGDDPHLRFRHDLVVAALRDGTAQPVRLSHHHAALARLRRQGARRDRLAPHLLALPIAADELGEVVEVAMACAPETGLLLVDKALAELADHTGAAGAAAGAAGAADGAGGPDGDGALTIARAVLLLWSGRLREAVDAAAEEIARHGAGGRRNVLRSVESHGRFLLGEARAWAPDKPDDLEPDGIGLITPERYKAEMALAVLFAGDAARARQLAEDALTLNVGSVAADEAVTEAIAAGIGGMLAVGAGQASRGHAGFGRMAAAVRRGTAEASFTGPELFHASALLLLGDLLGASAAVERDEAATDYATTVRLPVRHAIRAAVLFERGDWDSALAEVDASMAMSAELGVTILSNYSTGVKALVEAQRGDFDAAAATLSAASAGVGMEWSTWAHAVVAEGRGDLAGAAMVARLVVDGFTAVGLPLMAAQIAPRAARLTVATGGDVEGLRRLITSMTADTPAPAVDARRAWALGWLDDDTDAIIAAADALFAARYVGDAAMAWRDAAQRSGGPADARAVAVSAQLGIEFPSGSARPGRPHRGPGAAFGWEALSSAEARVLALLADGLDNAGIAARLFVSRRTVESHLSHVYTKLGVSGRSRLVAEVVRRQHEAQNQPSLPAQAR